MPRAIGVGGVFFYARDPKALAEWYGEHLGIETEAWGTAYGHVFEHFDAEGVRRTTTWSIFKADGEISREQQTHRINYAVDDIDAVVAAMEAKGVTFLERQSDEYGSFAWVLDPEGNKVEIFQEALSARSESD